MAPREERAESLMGLPGDPTSARRSGPAWPRRALCSLWALVLAVLASSVASSWEGLMARLAGAPAPAALLPAPPAEATPGERAIAEARRLGERGDLAGALAALDSVLPQDPAYPSAPQGFGGLPAQVASEGRWR